MKKKQAREKRNYGDQIRLGGSRPGASSREEEVVRISVSSKYSLWNKM